MLHRDAEAGDAADAAAAVQLSAALKPASRLRGVGRYLSRDDRPAQGEQPFLRPGQQFEYTSWCVIATPTGTMRGSYQMVRPGGEGFDAEIAPFRLALPQTLN